MVSCLRRLQISFTALALTIMAGVSFYPDKPARRAEQAMIPAQKCRTYRTLLGHLPILSLLLRLRNPVESGRNLPEFPIQWSIRKSLPLSVRHRNVGFRTAEGSHLYFCGRWILVLRLDD